MTPLIIIGIGGIIAISAAVIAANMLRDALDDPSDYDTHSDYSEPTRGGR